MSQLRAKPVKLLNDNVITHCLYRLKTPGHFLAKLTKMQSKAEIGVAGRPLSTELSTASVDKSEADPPRLSDVGELAR